VGDGDRGGTGYSRPPLARMMRLHEWLMAGRYPNCRKMGKEFEVSAKTVQRDVNFMRDQMGLPIEYDKGRFGFRYTRPVSGFPALGAPEMKNAGNAWKQTALPAIGERLAPAAAGRDALAVRIGFDAESARAVRGRTWHATQVIRALPGGGVEMTLRARDESDIVRWVLSWAGHARVIEPAWLRSRVREIAREILMRH
jgi:predicted DNA-binding transcriptional regulator YafY